MEDERPPVRISVTIEPSWVNGVHTGILEIPAERLDGLNELERQKRLEQIAADWVNEETSWGFRELGAREDDDDAG